MKIFQTQLSGLIEGINEYEHDMEDAARAVAQSIISDGSIYWYGEDELDGIVQQACYSEDSIRDSVPLRESTPGTGFSPMDTLVIATRNPTEKVRALTASAKTEGTTVVALCSGEGNEVADADFHFTTGVKHGLVPAEDGSRVGKPHLLMTLYLYYALYFAVAEILEEHDE